MSWPLLIVLRVQVLVTIVCTRDVDVVAAHWIMDPEVFSNCPSSVRRNQGVGNVAVDPEAVLGIALGVVDCLMLLLVD